MVEAAGEKSFVVATEKAGPIRRFTLDGAQRENVSTALAVS